MSEINNNIPKNMPVAKQPEIKAEAPKTAEVKPEVKEDIVKDFSHPSAEALGRSQVAFSGKTAAVENDVKYMLKNPEDVESANKFCDEAYKVLQKSGAEHPYEKATAFMGAYKDEFLAK